MRQLNRIIKERFIRSCHAGHGHRRRLPGTMRAGTTGALAGSWAEFKLLRTAVVSPSARHGEVFSSAA